MGTGILAFIKSLAPLSLYVLGIFLFLAAMNGKVNWALALVVLLAPLRNVVDRLQQFPGGGQLIDVLIIGMLVGWALSAIGGKQKLMESSPLNGAIILLALYMFISLQIGNQYLGTGMIFDRSDPRVQDWKNFLLLPLLYLITFNNIREKKWVWIIFTVTCVSMTLMDYYTSGQITWFSSLASRIKISGTFQFLGPNEVAAFYNQYSLLMLSVYFFMKKSYRKVLLLLLICVNLYCMVFMYSRAAYGAVAVGMFFLFAMKNRKLLIPLVLVVIFWQVALPEKARERILETKDEYGQLDVSAERRLDIWQESFALFQNNPIAGVGFGVFRYLRLGLGDTHNIYLKILVEEGTLGILIFLWVILAFLREGIRLYQKGEDDLSRGLGLGLVVCVVTLLVNNFFGDRWSYFELSTYLWIYAGLVSRLIRISQEATVRDSSIPSRKPKVLKRRFS